MITYRLIPKAYALVFALAFSVLAQENLKRFVNHLSVRVVSWNQ